MGNLNLRKQTDSRSPSLTRNERWAADQWGMITTEPSKIESLQDRRFSEITPRERALLPVTRLGIATLVQLASGPEQAAGD